MADHPIHQRMQYVRAWFHDDISSKHTFVPVSCWPGLVRRSSERLCRDGSWHVSLVAILAAIAPTAALPAAFAPALTTTFAATVSATVATTRATAIATCMLWCIARQQMVH